MTPDRLGLATLTSIILDVPEGIAVVDEDGLYHYVNPAGCRILGASPEELPGRSAFRRDTAGNGHRPASAAPVGGEHAIPTVRLRRPDGRWVELEYHDTSIVVAGRDFALVTFRDVTEARRRERQLAAFGRTASSVAFSGSLRKALEVIAGEVVRATGTAGTQIVTMDPVDHGFRLIGLAGFPEDTDDFAVRLEQCRQRGARLRMVEAVRTRSVVIARHRKAEIMRDPAWEPLHGQMGRLDWDSFVAVPLFVRDQAVGVLNAFYPPQHDPGDSDIAFLSTMADQAAVAVQNARLLADSKGRAALEERHRIARDLHDSIQQELFSMTLHVRALQLSIDRLGDTQPSIRRSVTELLELSQSTVSDMRSLIFELRPAVLREQGLVEAVRRYAATVAARKDLRIDVHAGADRLDIPASAEEDYYRLIQEALHNVVKHAGADSVQIEIGCASWDKGTMLVEVTDDGAGFDPDAVPPGHLGLVTMRERAEWLGGQLEVLTAPGRGTTVRVLVPRGLGRALERLSGPGGAGPAEDVGATSRRPA
ncbi:histidine kinase [Parafrankia soli]|nr:histidine kinase [Parafrankia soli]